MAAAALPLSDWHLHPFWAVSQLMAPPRQRHLLGSQLRPWLPGPGLDKVRRAPARRRPGPGVGELAPENFLITLTTPSIDEPGKQTVVIGCLVGDVRGDIDRYVDYSEPYDE